MAEGSETRNSNAQLLQELDALSQTLYQSHNSRRTASLALPRSSTPVPIPTVSDAAPSDHRPRTRRLSMSPWRSHPKSHHELDDDDHHHHPTPKNPQTPPALAGPTSGQKKGIWGWKPMRALSHIRMQRLGCLFSVEVVAVQGLPASMNGLRLAVAIRKKETREGAVRTMPARVLQGSADFEETLFIRCHVYCSGGTGTGKPLKFEPRPFLVSALAIDAHELDFGASTVDLSWMVKESMEKSFEGERVRQWDVTFPLSGKARGGELVLKLGFQIMEDGGVGIYDQPEGARSNAAKGMDPSSPMLARKQSKHSFSVTSPKISRSEPSSGISAIDLKGIDDFKLDGPPSTPPPAQNLEPGTNEDDQDLPEFDIVDRGIEIQAGGEEEEEAAEPSEAADDRGSVSSSSEVVKEVVVDSAHLIRLTELDSIAKQIKALESMMIGDDDPAKIAAQGDGMQWLDAEEETVTKEFLQMLELGGGGGENELPLDTPELVPPMGAEGGADGEAASCCFLSDLGRGLGSVVQTRDGGYLASMNPFDVQVGRKETPKIAMQISRPFVLKDQRGGSGFEVFQKLAAAPAAGSEELCSKLLSLAAMDELTGKTAEQIAFEGIASAIISGRSKEGAGASSSAAKSVAILKAMAAATAEGRRERIATGIWNVREEPAVAEEILAVSLQKMEAMAVEALKIQAGMAEEEAPFDASPLIAKEDSNPPLDSAVPIEDWANSHGGATSVTLLAVVQLRDPLRRYEAVGGPAIAVVQAVRADDGGGGEARFKVAGLHVGGLRLRAGRRNGWDGEKQRLTAMQWLVAYGLGKAGRRARPAQAKGGGPDLVWSISSRVMADMWLKAMRNPDVKIPEQPQMRR